MDAASRSTVRLTFAGSIIGIPLKLANHDRSVGACILSDLTNGGFDGTADDVDADAQVVTRGGQIDASLRSIRFSS